MLLLSALMGWFVGCALPPKGGEDHDDDGISVPPDCDDADPAVGAPTGWYADLDEDGYGAGEVTYACAAPAGMVVDATDCDDADATRHPEAEERCNEVDDDCDGSVDHDAVDAPTWYADRDGDGYGNAADGVVECAASGARVADDTDCDDTARTVHPDAREIPYDGADQDCDGADLEDVDQDGYGALVVGGDDCDDTAHSVHPGAVDVAGNGVDENCDGLDETDGDHDGYDGFASGGDDCDDHDPRVYPGAPEVCNGVDDDCDRAIDMLDTDHSHLDTLYVDLDGDGYGTADQTLIGCRAPPGYADRSGDCDDTRAIVNPGAPERCSSPLDENCDGAIDEADAVDCTTWYADTDSDGYGGGSRCLCEADASYVLSTGGDCDDADAAIHPEAPEVCRDGIDADCDGWDTCDTSLSDVAEVILGAAGDYLAADVLPAGDVDGDGQPDLLLGAQGYGAEQQGAVYVVAAPLAGEGSVASATAVLEGSARYRYAGGSLASGDFDGDGLDDVAVAPYAGHVYLLRGPVSGAVPLEDADLRVEASPYLVVAASVAGPIDLDGDGDSDLLVGSPGYWDIYTHGAFAAFDGGATGDRTETDASVFLLGDGEGIGEHIALPGDLDGDGLDDVAIGAPFYYVEGGFRTMAVYVLLAPTSGVLAIADLDGEHLSEERSGLGYAALAPAGDTDGDGYPELLVGAPADSGEGLVAILRDTVSSASIDDAPWVVHGTRETQGLGTAAVGNVDLDGDGTLDVAVRVNRRDSAGSVFPFLAVGTGSFVLDDALVVWEGEAAGDGAGYPLVSAGDTDGDGTDDLYVGARGNDRGGEDAGAVYLLRTGEIAWSGG